MTHEDFEGIDIRQELRAARSQPDNEFVSMLVERVPRDHRRLRATPRVALAFAATIVALSVAAAFGGISEAATAVGNAVTSIVHVGTAPKPQKAKFHVVKKKAGHKAVKTARPRGSVSHGGAFVPAPAGAQSPSFEQYHNPCPPDEPRGPYIMCRWPPLP